MSVPRTGYSRTPAFGKETGVIWVTVEFFVHFIVQVFVDGSIYFFKLRHFSTTFGPERTVFAIPFAASVDVLRVAFAVGFCAFKEQECTVSAGLSAFVTVFFFVENKTFAFGLVLPEVGKCAAFTNTAEEQK
jgi:hypothetical protein